MAMSMGRMLTSRAWAMLVNFMMMGVLTEGYVGLLGGGRYVRILKIGLSLRRMGDLPVR